MTTEIYHVGYTEIYHVGYLAIDRVSDPALDARALDYLERATPHGCAVYHDQGDNGPRGRGEGHLTQRQLWPGVYEYRYTPTKYGQRAQQRRAK